MDEAVLPIARRCRPASLSPRGRAARSRPRARGQRRVTPGRSGRRCVRARRRLGGEAAEAEGPAPDRLRRSISPQRPALARLLVADQGPRSGRMEGHERRGRGRRRGPRHGRRSQSPRSPGRARRRLGCRQRGRRRQRRPWPRDTRRRRRRRPLEQRDRRRRGLLPLLGDAGEGDRRRRLGQCGGHQRRDLLGCRSWRARDQHEFRHDRTGRGSCLSARVRPLEGRADRRGGGQQRQRRCHVPRGGAGRRQRHRHDAADGRYSWASYGSWVTLAAPGCSPSTQAGGGYADFCGTSSAAAFASGIAGLARSSAQARTSIEIGERLAASAVPVGGFVASGCVDAEALLMSLRSAGAPPASAPAPVDPVANDPRSSVWSD